MNKFDFHFTLGLRIFVLYMPNKKEPKDSGNPWLKFWKLTPSIIGLGHLLVDIVKLFIER